MIFKDYIRYSPRRRPSQAVARGFQPPGMVFATGYRAGYNRDWTVISTQGGPDAAGTRNRYSRRSRIIPAR